MYIYAMDKDGFDIKRCSSKAQRNREVQSEVNKLPKGTEVLVHFGVQRDGQDELCEGKRFTSV